MSIRITADTTKNSAPHYSTTKITLRKHSTTKITLRKHINSNSPTKVGLLYLIKLIILQLIYVMIPFVCIHQIFNFFGRVQASGLRV